VTLRLKVSIDSGEGLQNQIFEQVRSMILDETLRAGDMLPATRTLSHELGVSRNTMTLAYERLAAEGYIEMRKSVGTFVSKQVPEIAVFAAPDASRESLEKKSARGTPGVQRAEDLRSQSVVSQHGRRLIADFWPGRPDANSFPLKAWARLINQRVMSAGASLTEYRDPAGLLDLRTAIADHLRPERGIVANAENVTIVGGGQDGLNLLSRMMIIPGSTACIETPCYQGAAFLFESFGARLFPVRVDDKGIDVAALPDAPNSVVYVTPTHQFPLGITMSLDRRLELLAWAARTNSHILEDDYDSDIRYRGSPLAALKALDRFERVAYVGSFSKSMGAGLRLGYVVLPKSLVATARHFKTLMDNGRPWLEQAALADFMMSGGYDRHLRCIRRLYLDRRNALLASLNKHFGDNDTIGDATGMHLVWKLPKHLPSASEIESKALKAGVGVYTVDGGGAIDLTNVPEHERLLVLGFSSLSEKDIDAGIARLAAALEPALKTRGRAARDG
jgi:GntR family transcriptional regulator / MocR family aminotransferase